MQHYWEVSVKYPGACLTLSGIGRGLLWTRLRSAVSALGGRRQLGVAVGILSLWEE